MKRGSCNIVSYDIFFFFSEADILEHEEQFEPFYSSFVALAAHYLSHSLAAGKYTLVQMSSHKIRLVLYNIFFIQKNI